MFRRLQSWVREDLFGSAGLWLVQQACYTKNMTAIRFVDASRNEP